MSKLTLTLRAPVPRQPIDMAPLCPETLRPLPAAAIAALPLVVGSHTRRVDELFTLSGSLSASANRSELVIDTAQANGRLLDRIGAGMNGGRIYIQGDAGCYLGVAMGGGEIVVSGGVGAYAGAAMRGGHIAIHGDAGDFLTGPLPGERVGMRGGTVLVRGNVGARAGDRLRRGMILIEGSAGDHCGARLIAGTIAVLGPCGVGIGSQMRRGTLLLATPPADTLIPPTFNDNGVHRLGFIPLLLADFAKIAGSGRFAELRADDFSLLRRYVGDLACGGQGEILMPP